MTREQIALARLLGLVLAVAGLGSCQYPESARIAPNPVAYVRPAPAQLYAGRAGSAATHGPYVAVTVPPQQAPRPQVPNSRFVGGPIAGDSAPPPSRFQCPGALYGQTNDRGSVPLLSLPFELMSRAGRFVGLDKSAADGAPLSVHLQTPRAGEPCVSSEGWLSDFPVLALPFEMMSLLGQVTGLKEAPEGGYPLSLRRLLESPTPPVVTVPAYTAPVYGPPGSRTP